MDRQAFSGAGPCGLGCELQLGTAQQATASQNPFTDEKWVQKEQPSQVLDFTDTSDPVVLADFLLTSWAYLADSPQQGGTNLLFVRKAQLQCRTSGGLS